MKRNKSTWIWYNHSIVMDFLLAFRTRNQGRPHYRKGKGLIFHSWGGERNTSGRHYLQQKSFYI